MPQPGFDDQERSEFAPPAMPSTDGIDGEDATLPPSQPLHSGGEDATIPPGPAVADQQTIPPKSAASHQETTVGDQIRYFGDYELLEEIARGGMGVVYKARQSNLNRIVALKMILAGQFASEADVRRFYTEAEAAAQLDHPGIVPIFEIGQHAGQHYFSMAFVDGESLAQQVTDGPLAARQAAEIVLKVCDAMSYAHQQGVIHRDLKPANILIDPTGQPKVTDFGLAKKTEADTDLTGTGQILGTPAYMPPEQASAKSDEVGPLADIYSIGAVLYCLLTGRPPHQAASPMDTLLQVLEQEPVPPRRLNPQVPQDLESVCLKCLQKNPAHRYADCSQLRDDLQRFLDGEPTHARPIGSLRYAWNWYWHNLRKVAGALTLACCAFYAINHCVLFTMMFIALTQTTYWGAWLMVMPMLIALAVVLIGSKCGLLTIRGHRLSLIGSVLVLGFIAYAHLLSSLQQGLDAEKFLADRSSYTLTSYAHTLSIWFAVCIATQLVAICSPDRSSGGFSWREDLEQLRRSGPLLIRAVGLMVFGVLLMQIGGNAFSPAGLLKLAGVFCTVGGLLAAMRIR